MKVLVSQQQLAHGLGVVSRAVAPRSTLPVLANILVTTDEGRIRLAATNLEMGISCWIGAQIEEEGSITVPARTLSDLVSTLPNDNVRLTVNTRTHTLTVICGASNTDIKGIDPQEFPPMPVPELSNGIELVAADFKEMIQQVVFAASTDEARPVLQGILMQLSAEGLTLAATDGYRISVRKTSLTHPVEQPVKLIIPAKALSELARIAVDGEQSVTMVVPPGRGQVLFHLKNAELTSQLIEGNFPDYNVIIPKSFKTHTVISTAAFHKACKQAEIIAREGNNVVRLNIMPGSDAPGQVEFSAQTEETGASENVIDANVDGAGLVVAFNVAFLREALEVIKTPSVVLQTNANTTPAMIQPVGGEDFLHVIMPMNLG
jgi:DNA polymerase III subunit beta